MLDALVDANVQFVVVGEPGDRPRLRVVVSRHPTNLHVLGALLERLEASFATTEAGTGAGLRRIADPHGTVSVRVHGVDVDLMVGGPRRSLYAEALGVATDRQMYGRLVKWVPAPPDVASPATGTGTVLARRLLSIAEGLAHFVDRGAKPLPPAPSSGGAASPAGHAAAPGGTDGAGSDTQEGAVTGTGQPEN